MRRLQTRPTAYRFARASANLADKPSTTVSERRNPISFSSARYEASRTPTNDTKVSRVTPRAGRATRFAMQANKTTRLVGTRKNANSRARRTRGSENTRANPGTRETRAPGQHKRAKRARWRPGDATHDISSRSELGNDPAKQRETSASDWATPTRGNAECPTYCRRRTSVPRRFAPSRCRAEL